VCFMKCLSSRSGKSSLACAPRDSLRLMAEWMVCLAWTEWGGGYAGGFPARGFPGGPCSRPVPCR
jgi:hypothetical protein